VQNPSAAYLPVNSTQWQTWLYYLPVNVRLILPLASVYQQQCESQHKCHPANSKRHLHGIAKWSCKWQVWFRCRRNPCCHFEVNRSKAVTIMLYTDQNTDASSHQAIKSCLMNFTAILDTYKLSCIELIRFRMTPNLISNI